MTALDLTEDALKMARERAAAAGPPAVDNVTFKQVRLQELLHCYDLWASGHCPEG